MNGCVCERVFVCVLFVGVSNNYVPNHIRAAVDRSSSQVLVQTEAQQGKHDIQKGLDVAC